MHVRAGTNKDGVCLERKHNTVLRWETLVRVSSKYCCQPEGTYDVASNLFLPGDPFVEDVELVIVNTPLDLSCPQNSGSLHQKKKKLQINE